MRTFQAIRVDTEEIISEIRIIFCEVSNIPRLEVLLGVDTSSGKNDS